MSDSSLVVRDLQKRYQNGIWANRGINLTGNPGEILGLLGPNGAGKTTLVRQITSELQPTSGTIHVLGQDVVRNPNAVKELLGVVPQEATLFGYLTVHQHLRIFANLRGLSRKKSRSRADELIHELDLEDYQDVPIDRLSGGLKRRVLVGIAGAAHPPVMVLDEPTTGLDPQSKRTLWAMLRSYKNENSFVLLTTHNMEEAEALCDRVGFIKGGEFLALDTVSNLRAAHGFEFKLTYTKNDADTHGNAREQTIYGVNDQQLIAQARNKGVQQYAVSRTSLEDIYLAMTGDIEGFDDPNQ